jgi:hypothetical protein
MNKFLTPNIRRISLLRLHLFDILLGLIFIHVALSFNYVQQNVPHVGCHVFSITEKEEKKVKTLANKF